MRLFKWSKDHEIFLPEADAEHRSLYRAGEEFYDAILADAPPERVTVLSRVLLERAKEHFEHEERLMREAAFPSYAWHKRQHNVARRRMQMYVQQLEEGNLKAREEFLAFLNKWMGDHLAVADRMMGAHLRNARRRQQASAS